MERPERLAGRDCAIRRVRALECLLARDFDEGVHPGIYVVDTPQT